MGHPSAKNLRAFLFDAATRQWLAFQNPRQILLANNLAEIQSVLETVERATAGGSFAVGFLSYEAAPAFDPALTVKRSDFPLALFAIYDAFEIVAPENFPAKSFAVSEGATIGYKKFAHDLAAIKNHIARGNTYQVNYTFRLNFKVDGDAFSIFQYMIRQQKSDYAAFFEWEDYAICSASPELFFQVKGEHITSRPMKGTRPRGRFPAEDLRLKDELFIAAKDRAENVMIVDMIRNDLGRIAQIGSVKVERLYDIEKYPTVWQMTSTVAARTTAGLGEILRALFPCASITGAPKVSTMRIINSLETSPRKIYTGAIGLLKPSRQWQFNVAIRTLLIDKKTGQAEYGVGSGIVWDSEAASEWEECRVKARVIKKFRPEFELLETMLYKPASGLFLLEYHLDRLRASAVFFDFVFAEENVRRALAEIQSQQQLKVRLLLAANGAIRIEEHPGAPAVAAKPIRLRLAKSPIESNDVLLFHKTTHRVVYEKARAECPDADDVILWNERGEITETTVYNIVLKIGERLYTPPLECGLLAGTFRAWLVDRGEVAEKFLTLDDLKTADKIYAINSVQGQREAILLD